MNEPAIDNGGAAFLRNGQSMPNDNYEYLSQLADIGAAAAFATLEEDDESMCINPASDCWGLEQPAREAFAKAVLDAVGYKFPVDPEREAFERWAAGLVLPDRPGAFDAWKAGRDELRKAQMPDKQEHVCVMNRLMNDVCGVCGKDLSKQPETFEVYGFTWFKHKPGDPMPCEPDKDIEFIQSDGLIGSGNSSKRGYWGDSCHPDVQIIGWRYANADAP